MFMYGTGSTVQYVLVIKLSFYGGIQRILPKSFPFVFQFKKNIVRHCSIMYIRTYKRNYVYSFGFGSASYQTKTKPKPNQNHTKTIPKPYHKPVWFWFGFGLVFGSVLKPNQHQKRTKNEPKTNQKSMKSASTFSYKAYSILRSMVLVWFLVRFWYGFGLVLVWFWFGMKLIQNETNIRKFVCTYVCTLYYSVVRYSF